MISHYFVIEYCVLHPRSDSRNWPRSSDLCASRAFVCLLYTCWFLSIFSSTCCRGLAAACDCGIPWTFLFVMGHFYEKSKSDRYFLCSISESEDRIALDLLAYVHFNEKHSKTFFPKLKNSQSYKQLWYFKLWTFLINGTFCETSKFRS